MTYKFGYYDENNKKLENYLLWNVTDSDGALVSAKLDCNFKHGDKARPVLLAFINW